MYKGISKKPIEGACVVAQEVELPLGMLHPMSKAQH